MTDEIARTGCDEEEYVAIPKSEYEHLKAVKANYIAELENRKAQLMDEMKLARQQMNLPPAPSLEEFIRINNGLLY